jgi:hypothetical protein
MSAQWEPMSSVVCDLALREVSRGAEPWRARLGNSARSLRVAVDQFAGLGQQAHLHQTHHNDCSQILDLGRPHLVIRHAASDSINCLSPSGSYSAT